jgi:ribonucleoside-triphosphate reductase
MKVIKRDGNKEEFNEINIRKVIIKANNSVPKEHQITSEKIERVLTYVLKNISGKEEIEVEEIQDLVEDGLMKENCFDVAKSFILYREDRAKEKFKKLSIIKEIEEKLEA